MCVLSKWMKSCISFYYFLTLLNPHVIFFQYKCLKNNIRISRPMQYISYIIREYFECSLIRLHKYFPFLFIVGCRVFFDWVDSDLLNMKMCLIYYLMIGANYGSIDLKSKNKSSFLMRRIFVKNILLSKIPIGISQIWDWFCLFNRAWEHQIEQPNESISKKHHPSLIRATWSICWHRHGIMGIYLFFYVRLKSLI